jgi:hypothetical protein
MKKNKKIMSLSNSSPRVLRWAGFWDNSVSWSSYFLNSYSWSRSMCDCRLWLSSYSWQSRSRWVLSRPHSKSWSSSLSNAWFRSALDNEKL